MKRATTPLLVPAILVLLSVTATADDGHAVKPEPGATGSKLAPPTASGAGSQDSATTPLRCTPCSKQSPEDRRQEPFMQSDDPSTPAEDDVPDRFTVDFTGVTLLGHYRVDELMADGGMGSVYLGQDTNLERRVVIKVPHARFLGAAFRPAKVDPEETLNLSGGWKDRNGSTYGATVRGSKVTWIGRGLHAGQKWSHKGEAKITGSKIRGRFDDLPGSAFYPKGREVGGTIAPDGKTIHWTSGFRGGAARWSR